MNKFFKYKTQNILDYMLTYLGNTDNILSFMTDNSLSTLKDFNNVPVIHKVNPIPNPVVNYYIAKRVVVNTGAMEDTIGDFNTDFSNDFYN